MSRADCQEDVRVAWQCINDEVSIRREGVEAGFGIDLGAEHAGDVFREEGLGTGKGVRLRSEGSGFGGYRFSTSILGDFWAGFPIDREAVETRFVHPNPYREAFGCEIIRARGGVIGDLLLGHF